VACDSEVTGSRRSALLSGRIHSITLGCECLMKGPIGNLGLSRGHTFVHPVFSGATLQNSMQISKTKTQDHKHHYQVVRSLLKSLRLGAMVDYIRLGQLVRAILSLK